MVVTGFRCLADCCLLGGFLACLGASSGLLAGGLGCLCGLLILFSKNEQEIEQKREKRVSKMQEISRQTLIAVKRQLRTVVAFGLSPFARAGCNSTSKLSFDDSPTTLICDLAVPAQSKHTSKKRFWPTEDVLTSRHRFNMKDGSGKTLLFDYVFGSPLRLPLGRLRCCTASAQRLSRRPKSSKSHQAHRLTHDESMARGLSFCCALCCRWTVERQSSTWTEFSPIFLKWFLLC